MHRLALQRIGKNLPQQGVLRVALAHAGSERSRNEHGKIRRAVERGYRVGVELKKVDQRLRRSDGIAQRLLPACGRGCPLAVQGARLRRIALRGNLVHLVHVRGEYLPILRGRKERL